MTSAASAPARRSSRAAAVASAGVPTSRPVNSSASATLGVQSVARGASDHLARLLCGVRRVDPGTRAVANVRPTDAALDRLAEVGDVATVDRREEPADAAGTMDWTAATAMADRERAPTAIVDDGAHGKEPMARVFGDSAAEVVDRVLVAAGVDAE
ncbi:hypothetical protein BRC97_11495 [Halobacteriales archaeon QS_6_71_20]|nr:MAG: hypothetical protein BRC97_11495 [Halobacteriales archaeon QS_6_71_20]